MPTLNEIAKHLPGVPENPVLPDINESLYNLLPNESRFTEWPADPTNGRRFYVDPAMILLATADDSGVDGNLKSFAKTKLEKQFMIHRDNDLPRFFGDDPGQHYQESFIRNRFINRWDDSSQFVPHILDPSYVEHSLFDYIVAYTEVIAPTQENKLFVTEFSKWLIYDSLFGQGMYKEAWGQFYFRAWVRWFWLLVSFSESNSISDITRRTLQTLAIDTLSWFNKWVKDQKTPTIAESGNLKKPVIWLYFLQIANEICVKLQFTNFYSDNKNECSEFIDYIKSLNNTVIKSTYNNVFDITGLYFDINTQTIVGHQDGNTYPPLQLWLSINNKHDFDQLLEKVNLEWQPFYGYLPHVIAKYSSLNTVQSGGQAIDQPKKINPKASNHDLLIATRKAANALNDLARTIEMTK